jgi:hypothetical protein
VTDQTDYAPPPPVARGAAPPVPAGAPRAVPAGKALVVIVVALLLGGLFNSGRFVHAAKGMPFGWRRTVMLSLARPLDATARFLHTDRPREAADRALGRDEEIDNGGAFEDPAVVLPTISPSPGATASPSASAPVVSAFRDASAAAPLKLFVTGDSMIEFMAPKLFAEAERTHAVSGESEVKYGTGLVRDDFFDWPAHAREQMAKRDPDAVIMMMGGNDGQGMTLRGGKILREGTPEWGAEYQRRAAIMMRLLTGDGQRHVYWVGMPIARSARLAQAYRMLDESLKAAAASVPGVTYVDIWTDFAPDGRYTDFLDGQLVRARDGIHLNREGSTRLMRKLFGILDTDWKLSR